MCGGYNRPQTAEEYRRENEEYTFTKFVNAQGETAYLIEDEEDFEPSTKFDAVFPDGSVFGWDYKAAVLGILTEQGFTEASPETIAAQESVNA